MIPKVIHKIIIVNDGKLPKFPDGMKRALETWYRMNPGYKIKMYSGDDCIAYIKEHFDEKVLKVYESLQPYAYKCDLMRQLIMYNEGGWYSDIRQVCLEPIETLEKIDKEYYVCVDCPPNQVYMYNAFIGSIPKHPISKKMIDLILWNAKQRHYGIDCLCPTGPGAFMNAAIDYVRAYPEKCIIGQHTSDEHIVFAKQVFIKCKYNNASGADNSDIKGGNDYGEMWRKRLVYGMPIVET